MAKSRDKSAAPGALEYLAGPEKYRANGVVAIFGDDTWLKREVLTALRGIVAGAGDGEFSLDTFVGKEAELREVLDALSTMSLFGSGQRLVIVEEADSFVTQYRSELEDYVARPSQQGILALDVKTWPANTRLAKGVAASGLAIDCKSPTESQTKRWLVERAKRARGVRLETGAVEALLELLPAELGILDQELAKLTLLVEPGGAIDAGLVRDNVGGWRTRTAWDMVDAIADGRARDALEQLDRLITAGEKPHGLLPQISSSLRRFTTATRLIEEAEGDGRRLPLRNALSQAGVPPFKLGDAERQLRQISRDRARQLTGWLLAADLAVKSHNSSDERARGELERLVVRLSSQAAPAAASAR